jgi:hypothetical protein
MIGILQYEKRQETPIRQAQQVNQPRGTCMTTIVPKENMTATQVKESMGRFWRETKEIITEKEKAWQDQELFDQSIMIGDRHIPLSEVFK